MRRTTPTLARRHATRVATVDGATVDVYHAAPTRMDVALLSQRPSGQSASTHRADRCGCHPVAIECAATWNATCPTPADRPPWRVTSRPHS
jgi:hypothetical protein